MSLVTRIKIALALIGVVLFAAGIRADASQLRFIGIGFVAAAWVLRFVRPGARRDASAPEA